MIIKPPKIQNRIKRWVEKNPTRWYAASYADIEVEADVSAASLYRYYPLIVAKVAGILPSKVKAKRWEEGGFSPMTGQLSDAEIAEIQDLFNQGLTVLDIVFVTGKSPVRINRCNPNKKSRKAKKSENNGEGGTR